MPATLRQHSRLENVWSDSLTKVVINALGIIVVISFGWRLYNNVKDDKGLSSFFTITPEHISYKRISSGWKTSRKYVTGACSRNSMMNGRKGDTGDTVACMP
nr:unnamed protein product [Haemonchus contortus]